MNFDLGQSVAMLERSPVMLQALLDGLDDPWVRGTQGAPHLQPVTDAIAGL